MKLMYVHHQDWSLVWRMLRISLTRASRPYLLPHCVGSELRPASTCCELSILRPTTYWSWHSDSHKMRKISFASHSIPMSLFLFGILVYLRLPRLVYFYLKLPHACLLHFTRCPCHSDCIWSTASPSTLGGVGVAVVWHSVTATWPSCGM